ncbi:hypothetical protein [Streptomyces sp. NPDC004267]|uniref:hypothetical protein n=1 Tax=Streptomyces sp. NPDC004267 TaxID=3364694 RepID=UPI0036ADA63E
MRRYRGHAPDRTRLPGLRPLGLLLALPALVMCQHTPAAPPAPSATPSSGITGVVVLWPACPVEGVPGRDCGARPTEATVVVRQDGTVAATVRSGPDGRFRVAVAPRTYTVTAEGPRGRPCPPVGVTVRAGAYADVTLRCDSGIR